MKFMIRTYYSGYCTHEVEAESKEKAWDLVKEMPIKSDEVMETLELWEECDEIEVMETV